MKVFFQFAALHSLLMGLLPFFIPILLWQYNPQLWQLSLFIALSSLGFILSLPLWQKLEQDNRWSIIFALSFLLEIVLVAGILWLPTLITATLFILVALINGAYLCFYWMSQRTLFTRLPTADDSSSNNSNGNSGNNYGNFQLVVMVLLKVAILISAVLLDQGLELVLFAITVGISLLAWLILKPAISSLQEVSLQKVSQQAPDVNKIILDKPTRSVFFLDGIFLYLESYFWLLSLYLIAQQDVMQLGILVIGLTVLLAALFWLLKARIDTLPANLLFQIAIIGYGLSWLLRAVLVNDINDINGSDYPLILLIAFLTSFFRLSFNKRFFDHSHQYNDKPRQVIQYLLHKSYLSQWGIVIFFSLLGLLLWSFSSTVDSQFSWIYGLVAPCVLFYGFYAQPFSHLNKVDHHA